MGTWVLNHRRWYYAARRWTSAQFAFNGMFTPLAMLVIFAFIEAMIFGSEGKIRFSLADFLSFNAAFGTFAAAMTGLTSAWTAVIAALPLFERVEPILATEPETDRTRTHPGDLTGAVEFSGVSFRYRTNGPNAVDDLSFTIPAGGYVAFVGPSGSGKSTIYRLLLGFEQSDSGSVLLDGHDLKSLEPGAVRQQMGVVLQNSLLSAASIFQNIAGASNLTVEEAWEAVRAVSLAEDIEAMPMGMHTLLSERGLGLSGGQQQRLLIARALAQKPRILLLDEATSALDNRTQAIVQESLRRINATRILIAHRISTVQNVDRIHVLEAGRIVESGRFDELMALDGSFAALAKRQIV